MAQKSELFGKILAGMASVATVVGAVVAVLAYRDARQTPAQPEPAVPQTGQTTVYSEQTTTEPAQTVSEPESSAEEKAVFPPGTVMWSENGMFFCDPELLGMSFEQVKNCLGVPLTEPTPWTWWGRDLLWTEFDGFDRPNVNFFFQHGKCCLIYYDAEGAPSDALLQEVNDLLGSSQNVYLQRYDCYYSIRCEQYITDAASEAETEYTRQLFEAADMEW